MGTHLSENGRVGCQKEDSRVDLREEMEGNRTPTTSNSANTIYARPGHETRAFPFKRRGLLKSSIEMGTTKEGSEDFGAFGLGH